jgi:hypothetical protein
MYSRNRGNRWAVEDVEQLRKLASENTPLRVIGLVMGRSDSAIRSKASRSGISLKMRNQKPYGKRK